MRTPATPKYVTQATSDLAEVASEIERLSGRSVLGNLPPEVKGVQYVHTQILPSVDAFS